MSFFACGLEGAPTVELPDVGDGMCCYGAALGGPQDCTCWREEYDTEQQQGRRGEPQLQPRPCADCAYRHNSPERNGEPGYLGSEDGELDEMAGRPEPFYCHQGMRKVVRLRHEQTGATVDAHPADYAPLIDGIPYQADGTPALICAGWAARRQRLLSEVDEQA